MRRPFLLLVLAMLVAPSAVGGRASADGTESLGSSMHELLVGGGVVSQGVGLAGRLQEPPQSGQPGAIAIGDIPAGASVAKALLYWAVRGYPDATVAFAGQPIAGVEVGSSVDSWSCGYSHEPRNYVYRRDVTNLVSGNGTYSISGVGEQAGNDAQGASLVVLYEDISASTVTEVVINDGAITAGNIGDGQPGGGFEDVATVITGLNGSAEPLGAKLHVGFGDGQGTPGPLNPGAGPLLIGGTELAPEGFLQSTDGPLWDDQTFDVPLSVLPPGTDSVAVGLNSGDDCILWAFSVLEVRRPDQFGPSVRGVPDRAPNAYGWYDGPVTIHWQVSDPNGATQPPDTLADEEGRDLVFTSAPSCDGLGNCATGSITLSIDKTDPDARLKPQEFPILDMLPLSSPVRLFDQWLEGTATDSLSGIDTVRIEITNVETGESQTVPLYEDLRCNGDGTSCEYRGRLPDDSGIYRVRITAIDRAGNADGSPAEAFVVMPPNPFPEECPFGPLCD